MQNDNSNADREQASQDPEPRTAADEIDKDDPHKTEKLANAGKDTDVAETAEQE